MQQKTPANTEVVPTKGIEPSLSCENQILSLARLPIPPHGLKVECNNTLPYQFSQTVIGSTFLYEKIYYG